MAQPPPYDRSYNFHDYQAENPLKPLPADKLDEEFSRVKTTIDAVLQNLALIQRDDAALANKSVGFDQLKDELDGFGFNPPTEWEPGKNYIVRDTVFYDAGFYRCLESHVSSADFDADFNAGLWDMVADFTIVQTTAIAARDAALQAQADAEQAQADAEAARDAALLAQSGAESARDAAIGAKDDALLAQSGAESARDAAVVAQGLAEAAQAGAEQAQADAESARDAAVVAQGLAEAAQSAAEDAADRAEQAASDVEHPVSYAPQTLSPAEQAQARANIGTVLQSSATDTTTGRVLTVGAFGLGAHIITVDTDLDNCTVTGFYLTPLSGVTNLPAGWPQGRHLLIVNGGANYALQIIAKATGGNTGQVAYRAYSGTAWSNWQTLFNSGNILGTVSQSGGVPTGAIIERGSNANGEYVRLADGTMKCRATMPASASGAATWTFPSAFSTTTGLVVSASTGGSVTDAIITSKIGSFTVSSADFVQSALVSGSPTFNGGGVHLTAEGRWY